MKVGSICTGYGGLELGLAVTPAWVAEIAPAAVTLLAHRHPSAPNLGDITVVDWTRVEPVDLLIGGIPCQPVSVAGRQLATADPRWLWPYALDAIKALQPARFLLENVRNLVSIQKGVIFRGICEDLMAAGYSVRWLTIGACHVGLAHHRHRVFLLATREPDQEMRDITRVPTTPCGASGAALPTPVARDGDGRGEGDAEYWSTRPIRRAPLGALAALLPTPRTSDTNGSGAHGDGGLDLRTAVTSLDETWGRYASAIRQHVKMWGSPPPPTEPNRNGAPRLNPAFSEWLMNIPAGLITANVPNRNDALRLIGNGVSPPQAALAWRLLTTLESSMAKKAEEPTEPAVAGAESASPLVETSLGGASRESLRAASPVVVEIARVIDFHGGSSAQAIRDVLGTIERAAEAATHRRPANRETPELFHLNPPALRWLAALCRVWAPNGEPATAVPAEEPDTLTVSESPAPPVPGQAAEVARIEAELTATDTIIETLGAERVSEYWPDPFTEPAPLDHFASPAVREEIGLDPWMLPAVMSPALEYLTEEHHEPHVEIPSPAPEAPPFDAGAVATPQGTGSSAYGDDIPF